jgi:hypothetical protein
MRNAQNLLNAEHPATVRAAIHARLGFPGRHSSPLISSPGQPACHRHRDADDPAVLDAGHDANETSNRTVAPAPFNSAGMTLAMCLLAWLFNKLFSNKFLFLIIGAL